MGLLILRGRRCPLALAILTSTLSVTYGQTSSASASCAILTSPPQVRLEGLTERIGDLTLQCTGTPGAALLGSLTVFLPVSITNRVNTSNQALDATLSVNYGTQFTASGVPGVISNNGITFSNYNFAIPASGSLSVMISGIRAAVNG